MCNKLLCLTETCNLYEFDKHIRMTTAKKKNVALSYILISIFLTWFYQVLMGFVSIVLTYRAFDNVLRDYKNLL